MGSAGSSVCRLQRLKSGGFEVGVEAADGAFRRCQDVGGSGDGIGGDRGTAGQRFQQHEAESICQAGENEDVGSGIGLCQFLVETRAGEEDVGEVAPEGCELWAAADDDFRTGEVQVKESADVLFHGDSADIEEDWAGQAGPGVFWFRLEQVKVDASGPGADVFETSFGEIVAQALRGDHHALAGAVEAAEPGVGWAHRDAGAGVDVFGEAGVKRGGECGASAPCPFAGGDSKRPLGGDVQGVGAEVFDQPRDFSSGKDCERDVGVGRTGDGAEAIGTDDIDNMAHGSEFIGDGT